MNQYLENLKKEEERLENQKKEAIVLVAHYNDKLLKIVSPATFSATFKRKEEQEERIIELTKDIAKIVGSIKEFNE